jgi:hypothetical protein
MLVKQTGANVDAFKLESAAAKNDGGRREHPHRRPPA